MKKFEWESYPRSAKGQMLVIWIDKFEIEVGDFVGNGKNFYSDNKNSQDKKQSATKMNFKWNRWKMK